MQFSDFLVILVFLPATSGYFFKTKPFETFDIECDQQDAIYGIDISSIANATVQDIQVQIYCRKFGPETVSVSNVSKFRHPIIGKGEDEQIGRNQQTNIHSNSQSLAYLNLK